MPGSFVPQPRRFRPHDGTDAAHSTLLATREAHSWPVTVVGYRSWPVAFLDIAVHELHERATIASNTPLGTLLYHLSIQRSVWLSRGGPLDTPMTVWLP